MEEEGSAWVTRGGHPFEGRRGASIGGGVGCWNARSCCCWNGRVPLCCDPFNSSA